MVPFLAEGSVQEATAETRTSTSPGGHQLRHRPVAPLQAAVQVLEDLAAAELSAGSCWRTELTSGPTTPRPRPTADPTSGRPLHLRRHQVWPLTQFISVSFFVKNH